MRLPAAHPRLRDDPAIDHGAGLRQNRAPDSSSLPAVHMISPDALAYVRFGLRAPDDPRILNTVSVIDALLKVETLVGPA
jgi:glucoamylase